MGAYKKLSPQEFAGLRKVAKNLNVFWRSYFERLTLNLNKLFFVHLRKPVYVNFINRQLLLWRDYKQTMLQGYTKFFMVLPSGELGSIIFPKDLCELVINHVLGGDAQAELSTNWEKNKHSVLDEHILNSVIIPMINCLNIPLETQVNAVDFELLHSDDTMLLVDGIQADELVSVQQFSLMIEKKAFTFDIVLGHRLLEMRLLT